MTPKKLAALALMLALAFLIGCSGSATKSSDSDGDGDGVGKAPKGLGGPSKNKRTAVLAGKAVLKGKVTVEGEMPPIAKLNAEFVAKVEKSTDQAHCLCPNSGPDKEEQEWRINPTNKGLKNVVVFLVPEPGSYFACDPNDEGVKQVQGKALELHQPYCAFHPRAAVLFPKYRDKANKPVMTGQTITVFNDTDKAPGGKKGGINHNTKWLNENINISAGESKENISLGLTTTPVTFQCTIHGWMNANVFVLDHPYFAVTDENGEFEIKNAPAEAVRIIAWHEAASPKYLNGEEAKGEAITLTAGENKKNFTAKQ